MAGDRIQINSLERALSEDINDLQSMQSRALNDWISLAQATRLISNSGGTFDTLPQSTSMGLDIRANTTSMLIAPGILSQLSATQPTVPGALESAQRLGIQRGVVTVPLPGTVSRAMLLEAQVVDVTTVSSTRDVFDVPTQTFVPTLLVKQNERQIQYQIVEGSAGLILPPFTGDPWVPLFMFDTDSNGEVLPGDVATTLFFYDCRNDMKDILGDDPIRFTPSANAGDATVYSWACHTDDGGQIGLRIGGNFKGRQGAFKTWMRTDATVIPNTDNVVAGGANAIEHLYLTPLITNGVIIFPIFMARGNADAVKGILLRSATAPEAASPENSADITYNASGVFQNFDVITPHRATYVTTAFIDQAGAHYSSFTQSSGGRHRIRVLRTGAPVGLVARLLRAVSALSVPTDQALSMAGFLPPGARTAIVQVKIITSPAGASASATVQWELQKNVGVSDFMATGLVPGPSGQVQDATLVEMELPVHVSSLEGASAGMLWNLRLTPLNPNAVVGAQIDIVGWTF